jgi:heptosyltransferase I
MAEPRFLVLRLGSLGDIVHTFPAVAALRESFSGAEIIWLTHPRWEELIARSALASQIWALESRSIASLRQAIANIRSFSWDAAIDYQGLWKSAGLAFFGGIRRRIGFSSETIREFGVPILYTDRIRSVTTHIADQNGELSLRAGARNGVAEFSLHVNPEGECQVQKLLREQRIGRYIVLSPGGGWRSKCWPPERFAELCRMIRDRLGFRCIVNYGPGEGDLFTAIHECSGNADPVPYNDALGPLMALLRGAACIIGGDTGPLHLAIALKTPAVALFGPTDPARNGPYRTHDIVLRAPNAVRTHSRVDRTHPSMLQIRVHEVFEAIRRRLGIEA